MQLLRRSFLALALATLVPSLAAGQDVFGISGEDLAGRAEIDRASGRVTLRWTVFRRGGRKEQVRAGKLVGAPSAAALEVELEPTPGFLGSLAFWSRPAPTRVRFQADGRGGLSGTLEERAVRLSDQRALGGVTILVVPGLSTNLWNQYGVPYLEENLAALRARGLSARRLAINTEQSVAVNAAAVRREIQAELQAGRRVLLIAHSKGGADTVTALADPAARALLPGVVGLIAIQPVYDGSPIADLVGAGTPVADIVGEGCGVVGAELRASLQGAANLVFERVLPILNRVDDEGSRDAVIDLRTERRRALLAAHPYPVERVPTAVIRGIISERSLLKPRHVLRQPLVVFQRYVKARLGLDSDGMVSLEKQHIPGAVAEVTLTDLDHFEPGFRGESEWSPVDVTNTGLELLLPHLGQAAPAEAPAPRRFDRALGE